MHQRPSNTLWTWCCQASSGPTVWLGRSFGEHIKNLDLVLQRLREANLKVKPSKCSFLRREVQYLGHNISREGVSPEPSKTEKVATWPVPATPKEVQQFLGLAGYYRRFAKPLYRLTERPSKFCWTPECQEAFEELRRRLVSPPVLAHPDFSKPFILDTDASMMLGSEPFCRSLMSTVKREPLHTVAAC